MSGFVRVFNLGKPEDAVGPIDFAGTSYVINPAGARYRLAKRAGTDAVPIGNGKVAKYETVQTVLEKIEGSDGNKINFVDAPADFVAHIRQGKYADKRTPTGRLYKEILKPAEEVMQNLQAEIETKRRLVDLELAEKERRTAELDASAAAAEEKIKALEARIAAAEQKQKTAAMRGGSH